MSPGAVISFVGNKTDLRDGAFMGVNFIKTEEARQELKSISCVFHECSALTRVGLK